MTTNASPRERVLADWPFAIAAFLGSSLVFVVQPMIARQLLPTLGGAPAVWTTCVLFFQTCLLVGYAWAHLGPRWLGDRAHAVAHVALLIVACAFLPLGIARGWTPREDIAPAINVLAVLVRSVGLPLCALCATSPLIQRWHVALRPQQGDRVYRLYAIGNVASLLVLLAYPIAIEPTSTLRQQLIVWSIGFVVLAIMLTSLVAQAFLPVSGGTPSDRLSGCARTQAGMPVPPKSVAWWVALSAIPSSLLLGVTTYLTTDVAAVPFLWVLPLALYLGAFSLAFAGLAPPRVVRYAIGPGLAVTCLLIVGGIRLGADDRFVDAMLGAPATIALRSVAFFLLAWSGLAALYGRRPAGVNLTSYYLWIAVGGVVGGAFNSLVAPRIFNTTLEYPAMLAIAAAVSFATAVRPATIVRDPRGTLGWLMAVAVLIAGAVYAGSETRAVYVLTGANVVALFVAPIALFLAVKRLPMASGVGGGVLAVSLLILAFGGQPTSVARRSFFGVHRYGLAPGEPFLQLRHGTTLHGQQSFDEATNRADRPDLPLMYYHRGGPLGELMAAIRPTDVGVVGLGAGSIAAYVGAGQRLTYFEIDPIVIGLADGSGPFTFLAGARARGASVDVVEGDARLTLARQGDRLFDLLVLDAFSGDAIPAHLLTREAFTLYARRLKPDGTLAIHISNRYLDLSRVVAAGAGVVGGTGVIADDATWPDVLTRPAGTVASTWAVISRDPAVAARLIPPHWHPLPAPSHQDAWTDDYSNLLRALK